MPRRTNKMPQRIITELTKEQEAMIPVYRDKWRSIAMQTEPIDQEKVAEAIKATYAVCEYLEPEIFFYGNPCTAIEQIFAIDNFKEYLGRDIQVKFRKRVPNHIEHGIKQQLEDRLFIKLRNQIQFPKFPYYTTESNPQISFFPWEFEIHKCMELQIFSDLDRPEFEFTNISNFSLTLNRTGSWSIWGCMFDFCISVLKLQHDKQKWKVLQDLIQYCGFIFLFEKVCIVCARPCKMSFDHENRLHAEGEPTLQFPDGYSVYACHGLHPSEQQCCNE
jgi:hypothetical protein